MNNKSRLDNFCERIYREGLQIRSVDLIGDGDSVEYWSGVMPYTYWYRELIEKELELKIPDELTWLWGSYSSLALCIYNYGISGLYIYSPDQALVRHKYYYIKEKQLADTMEDVQKGDFVIGEYIGEQQSVLIRCDEKANDFGEILMTQPIRPREEWPIVGTSPIDFLEAYYSAGDKFWDCEKYWRT